MPVRGAYENRVWEPRSTLVNYLFGIEFRVIAVALNLKSMQFLVSEIKFKFQ